MFDSDICPEFREKLAPRDVTSGWRMQSSELIWNLLLSFHGSGVADWSKLTRWRQVAGWLSNLYGHEFRDAAGILHGLDGVFCCESPHSQCPLAVACHLDGSPINSLHVFSGACAATDHFHNKFYVFQKFLLFDREINSA
jgi:hypothetical protein